MSAIDSILPTGMFFREAWDFKSLEGTVKVPTLVRGGHPLTLTNEAQLGTTTQGTIMRGLEYWDITNNNDMNFTASNFTIFMRIKRQGIGALMYLLNRRDAGVDGFSLELTAANLLQLTTYQAAAASQSTNNDTALATDGETYTVAVAYTTATTTSAFYLNGVADGGAATHIDPGDTAATTTYIGAEDATPVNGFTGVIELVAIYDGVATAAEILLMHKGIIPDAVTGVAGNRLRHYLVDEGKGITLDNRGQTAATDGTYGTNGGTLEWDWSGAKLACLSLDGVNDYAVSGNTAIDLSANHSFVWVGRLRSAYDSATLASQVIMYTYLIGDEANNRSWLSHVSGADGIRLYFTADGIAESITHTTVHAVGDFVVIVYSYDLTNDTLRFMINGTAATSATGLGTMTGLGTKLALGLQSANFGADRHCFCGLVDGALDNGQAKTLSRRLDQKYNLGIGI